MLVVDEAGMVGTRHLARLLDHAQRQRVKVVLVGDPRQLPEIDAGGLFGHLLARLEPIQLTVNRRQTAAWEAAALDQLRHGDPAAALHLYQRHGRVTTAATADAVREQFVADWWDAHQQDGAGRAVMVALRQTDVDDLNRRARTHLRTAGQLYGPSLDAAGRQFQVGDRVLCLRNDRRLGVVNGTFATIERIDGRDLDIRDDHGQLLRLPGRYVDVGHVTHGYAITGHKAQGLTVDHTFVLGSDQLYREWGYVALSRGRTANRLYLHSAADPHGTGHGHPPTQDAEAQTIAQLRRSHAQTPAIAYIDDAEAAQVAARWRHLSRQLDDIEHHRRTLARAETELASRRDQVARDIARLEARREHLGGMRRLRRTARHQARSIDVQLEQHRGDLHDVESQLVDVRRERGRLPTPSQLQDLRSERAQVGGQLHAILGARVDAAAHRPPPYVLTSIGARPDQGTARAAWHQAVRAMEHYRLTFSITDPHQPLGGQTHDAEQRGERDRAMQAMLEVAQSQRQSQPTMTRGWEQSLRHAAQR